MEFLTIDSGIRGIGNPLFSYPAVNVLVSTPTASLSLNREEALKSAIVRMLGS